MVEPSRRLPRNSGSHLTNSEMSARPKGPGALVGKPLSGPQTARGRVICSRRPCGGAPRNSSRTQPANGVREAFDRFLQYLVVAAATSNTQYYCSTSNFIQTANGGMQFVWKALLPITHDPDHQTLHRSIPEADLKPRCIHRRRSAFGGGAAVGYVARGRNRVLFPS
jgi:hypothetical protein